MDDFLPYLEAEYDDGFVLVEDTRDHSPYDSGHNIFHAILHGRPVAIHGPLVDYRLVCPGITWNIRQDGLTPRQRETFTPICFRHWSKDFDAVTLQPTSDRVLHGIDFGYKWLDEDGHSQQDVKEFR